MEPAQWNACCIDRKSTRLNSSHLGISYAVTTTLFPYTTLFRSRIKKAVQNLSARPQPDTSGAISHGTGAMECVLHRSEEHTSELQSLRHLVCRDHYPLSLHDALPISDKEGSPKSVRSPATRYKRCDFAWNRRNGMRAA